MLFATTSGSENRPLSTLPIAQDTALIKRIRAEINNLSPPFYWHLPIIKIIYDKYLNIIVLRFIATLIHFPSVFKAQEGFSSG
ncbi:hypothetical protein NB703_001774 [Pantoea ananatis]|uniref:Uncharacterized protein n=1 Tax=Pantoea ananas TaxID=553 RepID=A0AAJ1CYT6_PANAN|nr:hypothetical protein [Pantoea ananatis]